MLSRVRGTETNFLCPGLCNFQLPLITLKGDTFMHEAHNNQPVVDMRNIVKTFGNVVALDDVSFQLQSGEIRALVGENGAGKSTLMNILYGIYPQDSGKIFVRGNSVASKWNPSLSMESGIGMIHQHFSLINNYTVLENIILPTLKWKNFRVDWEKSDQKAKSIFEEYHFDVKTDKKIEELSIGERQQVEISKALFQDVKIIILDEPTNVLTPKQTEALFKFLEEIKKKGLSVVLVTHKLSDVMQVSDNITVLRNGKHINTVPTSETTVQEVAKMMVDREIAQTSHVSVGTQKSKSVLEVENLTVLDEEKKPIVDNMSFKVHEGEILGIAGAAGNGQNEIVEAVLNLRKNSKGEIKIMGENAAGWSIKKRVSKGIGYIPEDRHHHAIVAEMSVAENLVLNSIDSPPFSKAKTGVLNHKEIRKNANQIIDDYNVKTENDATMMGHLSGGNQQKVVLGRALMSDPKLIIACNPTRGLDFSATAYLRENLVNCAKNNVGVMLISSDLDELLELSDRLLVIYNGQNMGILDRSSIDMEKLGMMMAGVYNLNDE